MKKITKAILPVAGLGTRFLPATKAQPKEMLPIFDTPAIQFIVEEAVEAGIEDIIIITGRNKRAIEDHFDHHYELEQTLEHKGKHNALRQVRSIAEMANFVYVRQPQPLGDGHAILCARQLLQPDESVVVLFGDDIVHNEGGPNAVAQMMEVYQEQSDPVVLLEEVAQKDTEKYGIVRYEPFGDRWGHVREYIEKPKPELAPSNLGAVGKYILTPDMFRYLENTQASPDGEIRLANAFADYIADGRHLWGRILDGKRFDTGDKVGFLKATLHFALKTENVEVKKALQEFLGE